MAILSDKLRDQLRARWESGLRDPVLLRLYTKPGSSRLILPAGLGCATCEDARQLGEALRDAAPDQISLEVIDATREPDRAAADNVTDVPTLLVGRAGASARIRFQGLPAGTEFAALVDAVERVSRDEASLSQSTLDVLTNVTEPLELMVFATPT